ncbi:hypothetical protein FB446DRAFT_706853 [Lentinula raphanica]|nr:hypothetical protein FB446DRAFT_706853 [Lentinula raphanica]
MKYWGADTANPWDNSIRTQHLHHKPVIEKLQKYSIIERYFLSRNTGLATSWQLKLQIYYDKSTLQSYAAFCKVTTFMAIMKLKKSKNNCSDVLVTSGTLKLLKKKIDLKIEFDFIR